MFYHQQHAFCVSGESVVEEKQLQQKQRNKTNQKKPQKTNAKQTQNI